MMAASRISHTHCPLPLMAAFLGKQSQQYNPGAFAAMTPARTAGILLLLTALATGISVATRLAGSQEPPPDSPLYVPVILDTNLYAVAGAARVLSGLALLALAILCWRRPMPANCATPMGMAVALLGISGIVTAASGACMLALAAAVPATAAGSTPLPPLAAAGAIPGWAEPLNEARSITGKAGFTLAGLALIALAPAQWRIGGRMLQTGAVASALFGIAMLFIWVDAATVMHRISGIAFLLWLLGYGGGLTIGLAVGRIPPPKAPAAPPAVLS